MVENEASRSVRLTDPRALRALAHPIRLALVGLLRTEGPMTATRAGQILGESPASCSFHLRQLAKYGLAEEAGGGRGRERPWRATAQVTTLPKVADDPELEAAAELFTSMVVERYFEEAMRWIARRRREPAAWREAALISDQLLYLTSGELAELNQGAVELGERYRERNLRPELRPEGSRLVTFIAIGAPTSARYLSPNAPEEADPEPPQPPGPDPREG
jgi:hypothetical protein